MPQTTWLIHQREEIATVEYEDDTKPWIERVDSRVFESDIAAQAAISAAVLRNWRILPAMEFVSQLTVTDGIKQQFRGASDLVKICIKYNLFNE